jgi:tRNA(Ile)-lysidine synthetase-like protein
MRIDIKPGKYVLAVSGGVDSMVLLDLLAKMPDIELIVAHFNHGMRDGSSEDEKLVAQKARELGLDFEVGYGRLGNNASEETARKARYLFLYEVQNKHKAKAVITAHHQDDLIETALINLLRGTGRKGIVSISTNKQVIRPLLACSKQEIIEYAKKNKLDWREDPTNSQTVYLRNALRDRLHQNMTRGHRQELICNIEIVAKIDNLLDYEIATLSQSICDGKLINRAGFTSIPIDLGNELIAYWLRQNNLTDYDKQTINRLNMALRTYKQASLCPVKKDLELIINKNTAYFSISV